MQYKNMVAETFLARPNRFIAHVQIDGQVHTVHVKNTDRCRELLPEGAKVWCQHWDNPNRKTQYDLIFVEKGERRWSRCPLGRRQGYSPLHPVHS